MAIEISDYDPRWPALAEAARVELGTALAGVLTEIEHIGSTSVPGLAAKPIIDLMAATDALDDVTAREDVLTSLGYRLVETGMPERLFYVREDAGRRTRHLHVVTAESWPTRKERLLRDHLLTHPDDRDRYAAFKRELGSTCVDGDAYTRAKTPLIQEMVDRARHDRGLPSIPVWEE